MTRRTAAMIFILATSIFILAACGGQKEEPESKLSQAQRDSVLSESDLPGASTVKAPLLCRTAPKQGRIGRQQLVSRAA